MPEDLMRYDLLAQNALKGVVREALRIAETSGLPGEHHFYVAFDTRHPGVQISPKLLQRYPREMTIVLQHQYWNLRVQDDRFEVELSFDNVPEHLTVPFDAVKGFLDPAVQFGLQFEVQNAGRAREAEPAANSPAVAAAPAQPATPAADSEPKVVSLDQFRKK